MKTTKNILIHLRKNIKETIDQKDKIKNMETPRIIISKKEESLFLDGYLTAYLELKELIETSLDFEEPNE